MLRNGDAVPVLMHVTCTLGCPALPAVGDGDIELALSDGQVSFFYIYILYESSLALNCILLLLCLIVLYCIVYIFNSREKKTLYIHRSRPPLG